MRNTVRPALHKGTPPDQLVIGLDCSTTGAKAIAFDREGKPVAHAHESIPLHSPRAGFYEQDPEDWWSAARRALKAVTHQIDPALIVGVGIANQRETFVPLDQHGDPLRPAIVWLDERCKEEVEPFAARVGRRRIHRITGKPVDYAPVVYRLAWMKEHEPGSYRRISMVADVHAYLTWKLSGEWRTSWASADPLGMFDLKRKRWSADVLRALGLRESQLPPAFEPGTVLGGVTAEALRATGLQIGTPIFAGGGDGQCAGLGSNVLSPKRAYMNFGTAFVTGTYGTAYRVNRAFRTMAAIAERGYYFECSLRAGTFSLDWFLGKVLGIARGDMSRVHKQLSRDAALLPPGSDGLRYLPYICGVMNPYWDGDARGAFVGVSSSHTRAHFYRALLEGIAFEQAFALKAVEKSVGTRVQELVAIGGGAANALWCSIMADVTGRMILIPTTLEASTLGAGITAAFGAGWYRTFAEAARRMTGTERALVPDPARRKIYAAMSAEYENIYPSLTRMHR
jgi:sugar (pentulose or hexulose) kinase